MDEETIGTNAGKVWQILDAKGKATRYQLSAETKLPSAEIDAAIGWLSKENKVIRDGEFYSLGPTNMDKTIGMNAEIVFQVLKKLPYSVSSLHKITELTAVEIHQAIGWLTREGNINLTSEPIIKDFIEDHEQTLQFLKNEVEILQNDVGERNELISQLSRQLTDRQTQFMQQAHLVDHLHDRLDKKDAILSLRNLDLTEKINQISLLQQEIQSYHDEILSRNQIITDLSRQLTSIQMESMKQSHAFEELQKNVVSGKLRLKPSVSSSIQDRLAHISSVQHTLDVESEIESFDMESSRLYNSRSPALDIQENQDVEPGVFHPKTIDEIHENVDQVIHEKLHRLKNH